MTEEDILQQAKIDVSNLVDKVVEEILATADWYHYEPSWVMQEFKSQLARRDIDE